MKVKIDKLSTSILRVIIISMDSSSIDIGNISISLSSTKKESTLVSSIPYEKAQLVYEFDLSEHSIKNPGDFSYVIMIADTTTNESSKPTKIASGAPFYISGAIKKIQNDFRIVAKQYNGSIIYLFKKIVGDAVCLECWDSDLMGSSNSNCTTCGGTGKMTYYSNPYKTYGDAIKFSDEKFGTQDSGKVMENTMVQMATIADFILTTDDMVYYENSGDWYRIKTRTVSELKSYPVLQKFIMDIMPSGAPETEIAYKLIHKD